MEYNKLALDLNERGLKGKMETVVFVFSILLQGFVLLLGAYYFSVSLFGWMPKANDQLPEKLVYHRFALITSAHNEETVIANLVDSLTQQNYPKEYYDIFIIADNCTDRTAEIAREHGAIVYERQDSTKRGKGHALEWMFAKVFEMETQYDSISIFDADNLVDTEYLNEMNKSLNKGYRVVQGYIDTKNPYDSWISAAYAISFWTVNRLYQNARYVLNLSCQLCGTGFTVATDILKELGWGATCLTEDMEFTMKLSLNGIKVAWAQNAVVYDEKPLTLSQSWKQRVRWMQGHADVASRFTMPLLKKAVKEKKWAPIDCMLYLFQPIRIITYGIITLMAWIQTAYPQGDIPFFQVGDLAYIVPTWLWYAFVIGQLLWTPLVLILEKRMNGKILFYYFTYYIFSLTWAPIACIGILRKNKKEWFHTQHTRTLQLEEMQKK